MIEKENTISLRERLIIAILMWTIEMLAKPIDKVSTLYIRETISKELNIKF